MDKPLLSVIVLREEYEIKKQEKEKKQEEDFINRQLVLMIQMKNQI